MKKVFLSCAALLFAGGVMAQNESKWRELARRDYEHCMTMADSLVRVWPQMSDEERRAALSALRANGEAVIPALTSEQISAFLQSLSKANLRLSKPLGLYSDELAHLETSLLNGLARREQSTYATEKKDCQVAATVNGILFLSVDGRDETVDFSNSQGTLKVEADRDEVYDVNRRTWSAKTKRGTEVSYTTYFLSNALAVRHGGALYSLSLIDGACDESLPYLGVHYYDVNGREWCIVTVYKDQALPLQTSTGDAVNGKKLLVKAGSVLVFETPANKNVKG
jgi:hypothetical protein